MNPEQQTKAVKNLLARIPIAVAMALLFSLPACVGPKPEDGGLQPQEVSEPEPLVSERIDGQPAGCWATVADYEAATGKVIAQFHQSPFLDGKGLPPVEERLGEEPLVVKPIESIGRYGGTMRILTDRSDIVNIRHFMAPATILSYDRDFKSLAPGLAQSWEFFDEGKTLILRFRKGMKWSDGHPFTVDDVLFWWEDIIGDDELTPVKPSLWMPGGEMMRMERIDDYTLKLGFKEPYPVIVNRWVIPEGIQSRFFQCKHYMKNFHPKYADRAKIEAEAKSKGFDTWMQYFHAIEGVNDLGDVNKMDCPTMAPYIVKEKSLQTTILERNPYFWKVDPAGNQLPYIDRVSAYYVESTEVYKLKLISGEVDFDIGLYTMGVEDVATLKRNEERGGYRTLLWKTGWSGAIRLAFNLTCFDPIKREIFNQFKFRQAMSLALDREAMNDIVLFGRGIPCQASVLPDSRWSSYYEEEFSQRHIEYDPDRANQLLDEIGLDKRDRDGFRLMPDGRRLSVVLMDHWYFGTRGAFLDLTVEYWADVGLELIVKTVEIGFRQMKLQDGDFELMIWHIDGISDIHFTVAPFAFVPVTRANCWGPMWYRWYFSNGEEGEAPPPKIRELYDWLDVMGKTMDPQERIRAGKEILRSQAENLWSIGTVGYYSTPLIANKRLRNVPENALWTWDFYHTAPLPPEAFYFAGPDAENAAGEI